MFHVDVFIQQGVIAKDDSEYVIEPLYNQTSISNDTDDNSYPSTTSSPFSEEASMSEERSEGHPHVIYKRSIFRHLQQRKKSKDDLGHCGYSGMCTRNSSADFAVCNKDIH